MTTSASIKRIIIIHGDSVFCYIQEALRRHEIDSRPVSDMDQNCQGRTLYMIIFPITVVVGQDITCASSELERSVDSIHSIFLRDSGQYRIDLYIDVDISLKKQSVTLKFYTVKLDKLSQDSVHDGLVTAVNNIKL